MLGGVGAVIARATQVGGKRFDFRGKFGSTSHVMRAKSCLIHPGDDAASTWCADSGGGKGMAHSNTFGRELVEVWCDRMWIAITAKVGADVFARKPNDIGSRGLVCCVRDSREAGEQGGDQRDDKRLFARHGGGSFLGSSIESLGFGF